MLNTRHLFGWMIGLLGLVAVLTISTQNAVAGSSPSDVRIAIMYSVGPEASWDKTVTEGLDRVAATAPNGLNITYKAHDAVYGEKAETVMRLLAKSGKYDIILSASAHSDQIKNLRGEFPELMWVSLGSGNFSTGSNHYYILGRVHQAAYLLGVLAAGMSDSGVIGAVGSFPAEDVNDQIHAYRAGARSVNPAAKLKVSFIESWYDPPKAMEATRAQAAAGADVVYQMAGEVYDACKDSGILCYGKYRDTSAMAPSVVLSSTQLLWDPSFKWMLAQWYDYKTNDTPFAGNTEAMWFSMADGGSDISPYHDLDSRVPSDLKAQVKSVKADIIAGKIEVPLILDTPTSD
jgi:basic membrane protein A